MMRRVVCGVCGDRDRLVSYKPEELWQKQTGPRRMTRPSAYGCCVPHDCHVQPTMPRFTESMFQWLSFTHPSIDAVHTLLFGLPLFYLHFSLSSSFLLSYLEQGAHLLPFLVVSRNWSPRIYNVFFQHPVSPQGGYSFRR